MGISPTAASVREMEETAEISEQVMERIKPRYTSLSMRGAEWMLFSNDVGEHIEKYTVPQYGDAPADEVEDWTAEMCVKAISKYVRRFGNNARPGNERLDMMKIAHFACLAYGKMEGDQ